MRFALVLRTDLHVVYSQWRLQTSGNPSREAAKAVSILLGQDYERRALYVFEELISAFQWGIKVVSKELLAGVLPDLDYQPEPL